jgi:hypothetical protein
MAWLSGYSKRIKLTIDYNKIDSALSNFPVTVFFTSSQGEEIFDEFDADSDYMKCAFTSDNGTTQLYAEKELFDVSEEKAIYHVKVPSISSSANTIIYYYFDNSHSDNTDYIGAIGTTAGANVWDSNFKAVYHMVDATTSTIKDSTSNNNDGTKKGINEPIEATGKVGQGQSFDGIDDYIIGDNPSVNVPVTVEAIIARGGKASAGMFFYNNSVSNYAIMIGQNSNEGDDIIFAVSTSVDSFPTNKGVALTATQGTFYHLAGVFTSNSAKTIYQNGVVKTGDMSGVWSNSQVSHYLNFGRRAGSSSFSDCKIDEFRFSSIARSASWIKATYNSLWDTLLTYGSAEMSKNINETLHTVDTILKSGTKALAESFNILDSFFGLIHLTETLHLADSLAKSGAKQLDEVIGVIDSILKSGIRYLSESMHAIDSYLIKFIFNELVNVIDSILCKIFVDEVIAIIDEVGVTAIKLMYETLHIVDWFWGKLRRKISDWLKQDKNTSDWTKIEKNDTNWKKE